MPYDPQRSHRRPRLGDDAAAPIDALLGDVEAQPEPTTDAPEPVETTAAAGTSALASTEAVARVDVEPEITRDDTSFVVDEIEVAGAGDRRPRVALLAVALVVLLLVVAWVRRRAPKR
jgi:hypothetical protein